MASEISAYVIAEIFTGIFCGMLSFFLGRIFKPLGRMTETLTLPLTIALAVFIGMMFILIDGVHPSLAALRAFVFVGVYMATLAILNRRFKSASA